MFRGRETYIKLKTILVYYWLVSKQIFGVQDHEIISKHEKLYRSVQEKIYIAKYQTFLQKYECLAKREKNRKWVCIYLVQSNPL